MAPVFVVKTEERTAQKAQRKRKDALKFWKNVSLVYIPILALSFAAVYWIAGLKHANII